MKVSYLLFIVAAILFYGAFTAPTESAQTWLWGFFPILTTEIAWVKVMGVAVIIIALYLLVKGEKKSP